MRDAGGVLGRDGGMVPARCRRLGTWRETRRTGTARARAAEAPGTQSCRDRQGGSVAESDRPGMRTGRHAIHDDEPSTSRWRSTMTNLVLYELGWFGCVLAAAEGRPLLALAAVIVPAAVHTALVVDRAREVALIVAAALLGAAVDTATVRLGVLSFAAPLGPDGIAPLWVVGMWAQFAIVFHFCLSWLSGRYWASAVLGAVGGPLSFMAGAQLGAVEILPPVARSAAVLAVFWSVALPALVACADWLEPHGGQPGGYRFDRGTAG